jgi:hypothetical protein
MVVQRASAPRPAQFTKFVAVLLAVSTAVTPAAAAIDVAGQAKVLQSADDFRFRVDACLKLGASGDLRARKPLEGALEDPHPTVRQAAASALAKLGDVLAVPALEARLSHEKNPPTKAGIKDAIAQLKAGTGSRAIAPVDAAPPDWNKTRWVVRLSRVANGTTVRGEQLATVLDRSTRARLAAIPGVYVLPAEGGPIAAQATAKGLPILEVDAKVVMVDQATFAGDLKIQARVSYAISKTAVIKSSIEGNASSIGSANASKNPMSLAKLQDMAVDGAVASAMGKAPTALAAATK